MALLLKTLVDYYKYAKDDLGDPRTADWLLVYSPIPIIFIICIYLLTVNVWLTSFMEHRKPFNLRKVLVGYNLLQIWLSAYIVIKGSPSLKTLTLSCSLVDYSTNPDAMNLARLTWLYYMVKYLDLLDTVFFILRKKYNQASFLHIYHHFGILFVSWVGTKYIAGGESIYLGLLNSIVHIVMYSYYLYSAWRPHQRNILQRLKKHVTQLQLLQFALLILIYFPKIFTNCKFSKFLLICVVTQNFTMIMLFGDFYYRTYIKRDNQRNKEGQPDCHLVDVKGD